MEEFLVHRDFSEWVLLGIMFASLLLFLLALILAGVTVGLRVRNDRKQRRWARLEALWEGQLLEVMAGARSPDAFLATVANREALFFVGFLLRYARRVRGEDHERLAQLARPFLPQVADQVFRGNPERRARAVHTLAEFYLPKYLRVILAALDDPSPLVAMVAARALARKEHADQAPAILSQLHRFELWSPAWMASMLEAMGAVVAPPLRYFLADPKRSIRVRVLAAETLVRLNDLPSADVAVDVLKAEAHTDLSASCLRILHAVGRSDHLVFIRRLCDSPDPVTRAGAVSVLGRIGQEEDLPRLRQAFEDPFVWTAIHAAEALVEAGQIKALTRMAQSSHPRSLLAREALSGLSS